MARQQFFILFLLFGAILTASHNRNASSRTPHIPDRTVTVRPAHDVPCPFDPDAVLGWYGERVCLWSTDRQAQCSPAKKGTHHESAPPSPESGTAPSAGLYRAFSTWDLIVMMIPIVIEQPLANFVGFIFTIMVAAMGEDAVSAVSLAEFCMFFLLGVIGVLAVKREMTEPSVSLGLQGDVDRRCEEASTRRCLRFDFCLPSPVSDPFRGWCVSSAGAQINAVCAGQKGCTRSC